MPRLQCVLIRVIIVITLRVMRPHAEREVYDQRERRFAKDSWWMNDLNARERKAAERPGAFSALDLLNLLFIALLSVLIVIGRRRVENWPLWLLIYSGLGLSLLLFLKYTAQTGNRALIFLRAWYTPFLFILHYTFTYTLNQAAAPLYAPLIERLFPGHVLSIAHLPGRVYFDSFLVQWDDLLFGFQPSVWFSRSFHSNVLGELMYMAYFGFYLFIPVGGLTFWFQKRRDAFDDFLFRTTFTMWGCCLFFILFPTAGPKYLYAVAGRMELYHGYAFARIMEFILDSFETPTGGFPSSHVAVSAAAVIAAFYYDRRLFVGLLAAFVPLCFSTVFTGEHYAVDVLGALIAAPALYWLAQPVRRGLERLTAREPAETRPKAPQPGRLQA
jgi:membrane-associated phospholipid phosphatase